MTKIKKQNTKATDESLDDVKSIFSLYSLIFRRYIKSPITYLLFLVPIILSFGLATVMPADLVVIAIFSFSIQIHIFILYGNTYFNFKKSTLDANISAIPLSKTSQQLAFFMLTFLTTIFFSIFILLVVFSFNAIPNFFAESWPWEQPGQYSHTNPVNGKMNFSSGNWGAFIYFIVITILVTYALAFCVSSLAKDSKSYMLLCMVLILQTVVFGGILTAQFTLKIQVSENAFIMTRVVEEGMLWHGNAQTVPLEYSDEVLKYASAWPTPSFVWVVGQFTPLYSINTWAYSSMSQWITYNNIDGTSMQWFNTATPEWTLIMFYPYMWLTVLFGTGHVMNKKNERAERT